MKQNQFYCVSCRKAVTPKADDVCVVKLKNKKRKGGYMHSLKSECPKCSTTLHRFISVESVPAMEKKYGKC